MAPDGQYVSGQFLGIKSHNPTFVAGQSFPLSNNVLHSQSKDRKPTFPITEEPQDVTRSTEAEADNQAAKTAPAQPPVPSARTPPLTRVLVVQSGFFCGYSFSE